MHTQKTRIEDEKGKRVKINIDKCEQRQQDRQISRCAALHHPHSIPNKSHLNSIETNSIDTASLSTATYSRVGEQYKAIEPAIVTVVKVMCSTLLHAVLLQPMALKTISQTSATTAMGMRTDNKMIVDT